MRLEIQAVDGHFVLFGATVYAAGGYGEAERLGYQFPTSWRRRWRG